MTYMVEAPINSLRLTAASPQQLIDELSLQRCRRRTADQMKAFKRQASVRPPPRGLAESAADARAAAEQASAVEQTADEVEGSAASDHRRGGAYSASTPQQQAVVDAASAVLPPVRVRRSGGPADCRDARRRRPIPRCRRRGHPGGVARRRRTRGRVAAEHHRGRQGRQRGVPQIGEIDGVRRTRSRGIRAVWRSTS